MDSQTQDVVIMAHVEALSVLLPVVHDPDGGHVVHDLARLGIEQVAPAIVTPVAASKKATEEERFGTTTPRAIQSQYMGLFF